MVEVICDGTKFLVGAQVLPSGVLPRAPWLNNWVSPSTFWVCFLPIGWKQGKESQCYKVNSGWILYSSTFWVCIFLEWNKAKGFREVITGKIYVFNFNIIESYFHLQIICLRIYMAESETRQIRRKINKNLWLNNWYHLLLFAPALCQELRKNR